MQPKNMKIFQFLQDFLTTSKTETQINFHQRLSMLRPTGFSKLFTGDFILFIFIKGEYLSQHCNPCLLGQLDFRSDISLASIYHNYVQCLQITHCVGRHWSVPDKRTTAYLGLKTRQNLDKFIYVLSLCSTFVNCYRIF